MNLKIIAKIITLICFIFSISLNAQEEAKIDAVLAQKIEYNKNNRKGKGFKIQLYNGSESKAYRVKGNFEVAYGIVAVLSYESPEWKVRVGNYKTRLEADRALLIFKEKFAGAIILETKIWL
ncbi:MAG: SPOR domain-containing protein [Flavobacteriaceae bacterium]|nr:SPOR domain-containing protein [Flavobacteriaceae bacterium]